MADVNAAVRTTLIRRAIERTRFENEVLKEIRAVWRQVIPQILLAVRTAGIHEKGAGTVTRLAIGGNAGGNMRLGDQRQRLTDVMAGITVLWRQAVADATRRLRGNLKQFVELEMLELPTSVQAVLEKHLVKVESMQEAPEDLADFADDIPRIGASFTSVPGAQMSELLTSPLGGANFAQSFEDLSTRVLTRLRNVLSGGLLRGEGVPKVTRAVKGLLDGTRWEAERIVRSEYVRVAGQAALIQFDGNKELLDGVRWVSALDDRTCLQCGDMDGEEWEDATDAPVPVVDTHPNCRCVIVPVVKDLPGFAFGPSTRAAQDGPVSGKETFGTWFPQQDAAFQRATLGPTRYKLFKAGALKLGDFSTAAGTRSVADALALAKRRGN